MVQEEAGSCVFQRKTLYQNTDGPNAQGGQHKAAVTPDTLGTADECHIKALINEKAVWTRVKYRVNVSRAIENLDGQKQV